MSIIPKAVRKYADWLERGIRHPVTVKQTSKNTWQVTAASDRVRVTVDFRRRPGGQPKWAASTLTVDGKPRELANGRKHLAYIFRNPDGTHEVTPMPPHAPVEEAPVLVQQHYRSLTSQAGPDLVQVGRRDDGTWVFGIDGQDRSLRLSFARKGIDFFLEVELVVDGVNRSFEVGNDLAAAMRVFSGNGSASPEAPASTGAPTPAARVNSVETRRATVIRV